MSYYPDYDRIDREAEQAAIQNERLAQNRRDAERLANIEGAGWKGYMSVAAVCKLVRAIDHAQGLPTPSGVAWYRHKKRTTRRVTENNDVKTTVEIPWYEERAAQRQQASEDVEELD